MNREDGLVGQRDRKPAFGVAQQKGDQRCLPVVAVDYVRLHFKAAEGLDDPLARSI